MIVCVCVCVCVRVRTIQVSDDCMSSSDEDEWKGFETSRSPSLPRVVVLTDHNGNMKAQAHDSEQVQVKIKYEMILFFTTGAPREPPLKFDPTPSHVQTPFTYHPLICHMKSLFITLVMVLPIQLVSDLFRN